MNLSSFIDAIKVAWDFVWPPILLLIVLVFLIRLVAPHSLSSLASFGRGLHEKQKPVVALLRLYGLRKFVAVIGLFLAMFVLYVTQQVFKSVGSVLPGHFIYYSAPALARAGSVETLVCLAAQFPTSDLDHLEQSIELTKQLTEAKGGAPHLFRNSDYWTAQLAEAGSAFDVVKALMAFVLLVALVEMVGQKIFFRPLFRLGLALLSLGCISVYLYGKQVYSVEQKESALRSDAKIIAGMADFDCDKLNPQDHARAKRAVWRRFRYDEGEKWWGFEFFSSDYAEWIRYIKPQVGLRQALSPQLEPREPESLFEPKFLELIHRNTAEEWQKSSLKLSSTAAANLSVVLSTHGYLPLAAVDRDDPEIGSAVQVKSTTTPLTWIAPPNEVFQYYLPPAAHATGWDVKDSNCRLLVESVGSNARLNPMIDDSDLQNLLFVTDKLTCVGTQNVVVGIKVGGARLH